MKQALIAASLLFSSIVSADVIYEFSSIDNPNQFLDRGASVVDLQTGLEWLDIGLTFGVSACEYEASFVSAPLNEAYTCINGENQETIIKNSLRNLILEDWRLSDYESSHGFLSSLYNADLLVDSSGAISTISQEAVEEVNSLFLGATRNNADHGFVYATTKTFTTPGRLKTLGVEYYDRTDSGFVDNVTTHALSGAINTGLFLSRTYDPLRVVLEGAGAELTEGDELIISQQFNQAVQAVSVNAPNTIGIMLLGTIGLMVSRKLKFKTGTKELS